VELSRRIMSRELVAGGLTTFSTSSPLLAALMACPIVLTRKIKYKEPTITATHYSLRFSAADEFRHCHSPICL
jgi:hypothetical protein